MMDRVRLEESIANLVRNEMYPFFNRFKNRELLEVQKGRFGVEARNGFSGFIEDNELGLWIVGLHLCKFAPERSNAAKLGKAMIEAFLVGMGDDKIFTDEKKEVIFTYTHRFLRDTRPSLATYFNKMHRADYQASEETSRIMNIYQMDLRASQTTEAILKSLQDNLGSEP
ncbi:MAG: hypothetical protein WBK77_07525 [Alphaproteobacteria bacterium]